MNTTFLQHPLPTKNRSEILREAIEEMIAVGTLRPGHHLDETELAKQFGVSRTPIREALIQLASMGIIVMRPRRGAVVAETGPQQLIEMFEVMAEFEAMCGRLAARRMSATEHSALLAAHQACKEARDAADPDQYFYMNEAFHEQIYAGRPGAPPAARKKRNRACAQSHVRIHPDAPARPAPTAAGAGRAARPDWPAPENAPENPLASGCCLQCKPGRRARSRLPARRSFSTDRQGGR